MNTAKIQMDLSKEVRIFRSIDSIGKATVDSLAVDGFFTYGWFKSLETQNSIKAIPIYLTVYEGSKVVAIAPCFIDLLGDFLVYTPKIAPFFQRIVTLGQRFRLYNRYALLCYSPFCFRSKILLEKNLDEKCILELLAEKIDVVCRQERILFSAFLFVSEFDKLLMGNLQNYGYLKFPNITTYYLEIKWSTFEEYMRSLERKTAKAIRHEIKKFRENLISVEEIKLAGLAEKLSCFASNLASKYSKRKQESVLASLLTKLDEFARDKTKLFIAKKNNEIVGFSLDLRHNEVLDSWIVGFDYGALTKTDFAYFNLCYYLPIQWAINEGIRKIYYRYKTENVKIKRGCQPEKNFAFVKCNNKILSILIISALKNRLYSHLRSRYLSS